MGEDVILVVIVALALGAFILSAGIYVAIHDADSPDHYHGRHRKP